MAKKNTDIVEETTTTPPQIGDVEWTDYVISLLKPNELENGQPKTDALRRVARKLLGPFSIRSNVVETPKIENAFRATVTVTVEFPIKRQPKEDDNWVGAAYTAFEGSADVFSGNTESDYAKHAVATAETRAEGRALRKALFLSRVLAAEELHNAAADEPDGTDKRTPVGMLTSLQVMAQRVGVDPFKLAVKMGYTNIAKLSDLRFTEAQAVAESLVKYSRKELEVPAEIKL